MDKSTTKSCLSSVEVDVEVININEYMAQLTPLQLKAYQIAKEHLKTSFDITRSNGFNEWIKVKVNK